MFFAAEGFTYRNFLMEILAVFIFIAWFWLLITVASDLFRRHDISGWIKAIWVIVFIVAPLHRRARLSHFSRKRHGRARCPAEREKRMTNFGA